MKIIRVIASGIIAATFGLATAEAQSIKDNTVPAEVPPQSFTGKQYVDSRGCVFIRAGIDGVTTWVPRVSRDRKVLCGYQPTFASDGAPKPDASQVAQAPAITPDPEPAQVASAATPEPAAPKVKPVAKPVAIAPKPAPRPAAAPKPAPRRVATAAPAPAPRKPAPAPAAKPVAKPAPAPASTAKSRQVTRAPVTDCPNVTGISRYYTGVDNGRGFVRCGPQQAPLVTRVERKEVTVMRAGKPVTVQKRVATRQPVRTVVVPAPAPARATAPRRVDAASLPPGTRIVPRHVYEQQQAARINGQKIPDGYRKAWNDDRLNPKRAHQTIDGALKSGLAWTNTVPRRLYERDSGRVVTHLYPGLIYPYHSYAEMQAAGYSISTKGPLREPRTLRPTTTRKVVVRKPAEPGPRLSTKAAPRKPAATAGRGGYVQVGTFGDPANAQRTAARLQSMGLPVRMGKYTKGGREYRIVLAGPFAADQVGAALNKARRAGFSDAFLRK